MWLVTLGITLIRLVLPFDLTPREAMLRCLDEAAQARAVERANPKLEKKSVKIDQTCKKLRIALEKNDKKTVAKLTTQIDRES